MINQLVSLRFSKHFGLWVFVLLVLGWHLPASGQSCCGNHLDNEFLSTQVATYTYAQNLEKYDGSMVDGVARVWTSDENTCLKKPLLVLVHGGGFTAGGPYLMDSLAMTFAQKGYVAASISYRTGWLGSGYCSYDTSEAIRAWYRSVQDCQKAIDYFKTNQEVFGIDTNLIFLAGWSAGGYVALGASFLDDDSEKPADCFEQAPLNIDAFEYLRPDLGEVHLDIPEIKAVATFSSSMIYPEMINQGLNPAIISFNNELDPYLIPLDTCDVWWQIDNCAATYPHSCGIQSLVDELASRGVDHQVNVYASPTCPHNLHEPCFPFWHQEVEAMAIFFQTKMNCDIPLSNTILDKNHVAIIPQGKGLAGINLPKEFVLVNASGMIINNQISSLECGFYLIKDLNSTRSQRILVVH